MKALFRWLLLVVFSLPLIAVAQGQNASGSDSMKVTSSAFSNGGKIPKKYTCDDADLNPPLRIENLPKGAKAVALIMEDPDAPSRVWTHWVVWNIDPKATEIRENSIPQSGVQGTNDFGNAKYGGPCPPSGTHRYYFRVYALDGPLTLAASATKSALEKAMAGHIVAKGSLMGTYSHGH
jgi:Raf kinase inhibitor-like YbhB/YbcL family protein